MAESGKAKTHTVHFETLGCRLNQVESEGAARSFVEAGFSVSMEPLAASDSPDDSVFLCIVNTCTVTAKAEQKARRIIRLLLSRFPRCAVVVTGCYAQLDAEKILSIDSRVAVLGGQKKGALADLPEQIKRIWDGGEVFGGELRDRIQEFFGKIRQSSGPSGKIEILQPFRLSTDTFLNHSRSSLKIQDGCDFSCSYCRIRLARGKSVSLAAAEVLERVRSLEAAGQEEVVITTVNISLYRSSIEIGGRWNFSGEIRRMADSAGLVRVDFATLLELILDNTKKIGIRISSLYPEIVDERLASVAENPRVRPHFHISVQSGSDGILSKMRRPYRSEVVYSAVSLLRRAKGNPFLACDVIAGFPGESDEDFALTMKMLAECRFTFVHAFPFSARPGTEAFRMRPMVPNSIIDSRIKALESFSRNSKSEYISSFSGKVLPAVCESVHRARNKAALFPGVTVVHAVTENFLHCRILLGAGSRIPVAGSAVRVRIIRALNPDERVGESDTLAEVAE